ncbi:DNA repair protein SWI5 homolog [Eumetopias jubatus]|uniref:DNA repair protein SWI5 homolog n=1 Tax=Eumetopias jubatus TaxID=34886 RepID=UPI001015CC10|nr:DNA repair protein SWI5 homolog [Eumetopias jubatus]
MKAERAAAVPAHLAGGAGPELAGCARTSLFDRAALPPSPWTLLHCILPRDGDPGPQGSGERTLGSISIFFLGFLSRTQPGLSKSCRGAFQSPRPSPKSGQADGASEDSLHLDIQKLKEKRDLLDKEITQLISEGYSVNELEDHISLLHEYNDIKDVGQMLLGKLAVIRGVTTKELYPEFGLDMND